MEAKVNFNYNKQVLDRVFDGLTILDPDIDNATPAYTNPPLDESHTPKQLTVFSETFKRVLSPSEIGSVTDASDFVMGLPVVTNRSNESRVLVLYTGGTIGMKCDGVYKPEPGFLPTTVQHFPPLNDKEYIEKYYADAEVKPYCLPPVKNMTKRVVYWILEYDPLLDSSDMTFDDWIRIGEDIHNSYSSYDGFVILHGTDTLAYTACALSFMFENLGKPVILTGSQIPVCEVRSDGRENLIGALIVAGNLDIPEVTVYFNNHLLRGNRSTKVDNSALDAFQSPNMRPLAKMDTSIKVDHDSIYRSSKIAAFRVHGRLCRNVGLLRLFPSVPIEMIRSVLQPPTQGIVLQTFGAGNMPARRTDIIDELRKAVDRGCIIVNCSQCLRGQVDAHYLTGKILYDVGVLPGSDMTTEAALTKLAYVLGQEEWSLETKRKMMQRNIRGEITVSQSKSLKDMEFITDLVKALHVSSSREVQMIRDALFPTLLCYAASTNNIELLEQLRTAGATFSSTDYNGRSALHVAAVSGLPETVRYLLKHGTNVHTRDHYDENTLMSAIRSKNLECIRLLKDCGAKLQYSPIKIGMELCLSASCGDRDALDAWICAGADINQPDYDGRTALHSAVKIANEELVIYLLNNNGNPYAVDNFGKTPISEAQEKGMNGIARTLLGHSSHVFFLD